MEDLKETWETSDHPFVHKVQEYVFLILSVQLKFATFNLLFMILEILKIGFDYSYSVNERIFGETHTAISFKEIRLRDPYVTIYCGLSFF